MKELHGLSMDNINTLLTEGYLYRLKNKLKSKNI